MKVKVFLETRNEKKEISLKEKSEVKDLLKKLKVNPITVIISRKNELITEEDVLFEGDTIKIHSVVSGG